MEVRILYHGLGMAGKTTNLEKIKEMYSHAVLDRFHQSSKEGRTVYLDMLTLKLKTKVGNEEVLLSLFTTPGQERFRLMRPWLFGQANSAVFVFDSTRSIEENLESFKELEGLDCGVVIQANKRDAENALPMESIERVFSGYTIIPAVAKEGIGVLETLKEALRVGFGYARKTS